MKLKHQLAMSLSMCALFISMPAVSEVASEHKIIYQPAFSYPQEAKKQQQSGDVLVAFAVDAQGKVVQAAVKQSSGHDILDQSALKAIKQVRVNPIAAGSPNRHFEQTVSYKY